MKQQTIAAAIIVKGTDDEAPLIARALASISGYVDAIYINLNHTADKPVSEKVKKVCEQYATKVFTTLWTNDFAGARNFIYKQVPKDYDWIFWMDSDDIVDYPNKIKDIANAAANSVHGIYALYDYAHDEFGNVTYTHQVLRLTRNNGAYFWKSSFDDGEVSVHETLQENRTVTNVRTEDFKVIHKSNPDRGAASLVRNIELLEGMYKRMGEKGKVDPRISFYLATHYFEAASRDPMLLIESKNLLTDYLRVSGWYEERSEAWVYLGLIFRIEQNMDASRQAFVRAIAENPANPKPYVELGEIEFNAKRYNVSEEWLLMAIDKKTPTTSTVIMPMENQFRAYLLLAQTYLNMSFAKLKEAKKYVNKALKLRPLDEDAKNAQKIIEEMEEVRNNTKAILRVARTMEKNGKKKEISKFIEMIPEDLQDNPAVINLRIGYQEPKKWKNRSIAIFCGNSSEGIWGPWQINEDGMGGSEEAVIHMSNQLNSLGYEVVVYATPGSKKGNYDGVEWKQYWEFNPKDEFDVVVAWRMPWFFDADIKARKKYLWLHDVMDKEEFIEDRLKKIDKVLFVSQYHADLYADVIPDIKRFVSGNGILPEDFRKYDSKFKRRPHSMIYTSSQLRGLEILYEIWPEVKAAVPDATLDVYYGWKTYDEMARNNPERQAWKNKMIKWAEDLDGVTDHGRSGQDALNQELFKTQIFAYPCIFPEVYCISLIKAMAAGCYPVTSNFAVLKDFNIFGTRVKYDPEDIEKFKQEYTKKLIFRLQTKAFIEKHKVNKIRNGFSWQKTAKGWVDLFEE